MLRSALIILPLLMLFTGVVLASSPQDELRGVRREIREKQTLLKKTKKVEAAVSQELQEILKNLERKEAELKQLDRDLTTVEGAIRRTQQEVARVTEEAQL
ncbi:MAG: peptidase M23, partial [Geobacter sp.]